MAGKVYKTEGPSDTVEVLTQIGDGVMGTSVVKRATKPKPEKKAPVIERVAIHSTRGVFWEGVGTVSKGYNIVTQEQADKWLTRGHTRIATPEEVAREYGL